MLKVGDTCSDGVEEFTVTWIDKAHEICGVRDKEGNTKQKVISKLVRVDSVTTREMSDKSDEELMEVIEQARKERFGRGKVRRKKSGKPTVRARSFEVIGEVKEDEPKV